MKLTYIIPTVRVVKIQLHRNILIYSVEFGDPDEEVGAKGNILYFDEEEDETEQMRQSNSGKIIC